MERTLSIIKPDATRRSITGKINAMIEEAGLSIIAQKRILLSETEAEEFYGVHKERPFFRDLVKEIQLIVEIYLSKLIVLLAIMGKFLYFSFPYKIFFSSWVVTVPPACSKIA